MFKLKSLKKTHTKENSVEDVCFRAGQTCGLRAFALSLRQDEEAPWALL